MMRFDKQTLDSLEYPRIKEHIAKHCWSTGGQRFVERLKPTIDSVIIDDALSETMEMADIIRFEESFPLTEAENVDKLIEKLGVAGSMLDAEQLKRLADFQQVILAMHQYRRDREEKFPRIVGYLKQLDPLDELVLQISRAVDRGGEIKDSASDHLRRIRADKINARARIMDKLTRILGHQRHKPDRVDDIITLREGRYVISVPDTEFDSTSGIVHDRSGSGATLYVEPSATVELNNKLKQLELAEKEEIEKILTELTDFARGRIDELERNWALFSKLDFIHAKGKFAVDLDATMPVLKTEPVVNLKQARHPLLLLAASDKSTVVPIDVELGDSWHVLIITGPNTGGKTVSVKTVGLLIIMVQSGLLIPADEKTELGIFEKVFADIGDEQSIELSLSTFSSHISRIVAALDQCDRNSLLLFDEIGAGTDPKEGAALGEAIIEYVVKSDARCLVTTHYSALKTIAEYNEKVENASFEFDRKTLNPTYRLHLGLPGSSYAVEIAERLGMPRAIVARAHELVGSQERTLGDLIARLEEQRNDGEAAEIKLREQLANAEELERSLEERSEQISQREKELEKEAYAEAEKLVEDARRRLDDAIRGVREGDASRESVVHGRKTIEELRRELAGKTVAEERKLAPDQIPDNGDKVWVEKLQTEGELIEKFADGKKGKVRIGKVLYTVNLAGLRKLGAEKTERRIPAGVNYEPFKEEVRPEVSLIGMTVEEAVAALDKYFDSIALANLPTVRIVHGKGTGALRRAVREYLSKQKMVESFELGQWNEGGSGVTIAKLK
jgi:DNA mismatch repair protein MutS2